MDQAARGWHSRGYLPHFDGGDIAQAVTFRLADSLPRSRQEEWRMELRALAADEQEREYRKRVQRYLDRGAGACWLRVPAVGRMVEEALLHFDGTRYRIYAWVVMPNHVHTVFTPIAEWSLSRIIHAWKSFTSHEARRLLGRKGDLWQPDYFDRYTRSEEHFLAEITYIEMN